MQAKYLAGGSLIALEKNKPDCPPDVRPIECLRLMGKCLCIVSKQKVDDFLMPHQMGAACPSGSEKIIHGLCYCVDENWFSTDFTVLKRGFRNAFNLVSHQAVLDEWFHHFPEPFPWTLWCYSQHPSLLHSLAESETPFSSFVNVHAWVHSSKPKAAWVLKHGKHVLPMSSSPNWELGKSATIDHCIKSLLNSVTFQVVRVMPGSAAMQAEKRKHHSNDAECRELEHPPAFWNSPEYLQIIEEEITKLKLPPPEIKQAVNSGLSKTTP
ncbi:hypothetical protein EMCRGX_G006489 [Ephydatia muelleri]